MSKSLREWIVSVIVAAALMILINTFFAMSYTVNGESMSPTFHDGDRVMVNKVAKAFDRLDRSDVIIFHTASGNDYIKRLIGLPGDTVTYKDDVLRVNGEVVKEPYLDENERMKVSDQLTEDFRVGELVHSGGRDMIPNGYLLVLGDNRENSLDSRYSLGLVKKKDVVGRVALRFYPFDAFRFGFDEKSFGVVR